MKYRDFNDYVAHFQGHNTNVALTIRHSIKIEHITYATLQQHAYQIVEYLTHIGLKSGDRLLVVAPNAPEWIELFFGAQLMGVVIVPVDASTTIETVKRFIDQTKPRIIFRGAFTHPELDVIGRTHLLDTLHAHIESLPANLPSHLPDPDAPALIVFTSGTTADPKGVVLSQKNILTNITDIQAVININPSWRLLSVLPLSHMYELTGTLAVLSRGGGIFYVPRVTPAAIARALPDYGITAILAVPELLSLLLERIRQTAKDEGKYAVLQTALHLAAPLPLRFRRILFRKVHVRLGGQLNLVVTGGAPVPTGVAKTWECLGVRILQGYGLTETSPILTVNGLDDRRIDSPGKALKHVSLRVGKEGEIQAKGSSIFREYWHNKQATNVAFTEDGWFRTGDVGRLEDGWLHIQGRLKFAIVLASGLKVFPEDIEVIAAKQAIFTAFCTVGVKEDHGESVTAVIISKASDTAIDKAIAVLNTHVESFQHISSWRRWPDDDFPRTRLLKIDRRKVQEWANNQAIQIVRHAPITDYDPLSHIISIALDQPQVHFKPEDRLTDVGLDSLRRLTLLALIEERIGVTIAESTLAKTVTVGDVWHAIDTAAPVTPPVQQQTWPLKPVVRLIGNILRDIILHGIVHIWVDDHVEGLEHLEGLQQPALFVFNHVDDFDGPVVYQALPRNIRNHLAAATAADVLHKHKVLAVINRLCFAGFALSRSEPYTPSLEYVGKLVDQGWNILISPEGRISPSGRPLPFKPGVGLLAVNLGVPIVPVKTIGLRGTVPLHSKWPKKRSKVTVRIGIPITFGPNVNYEQATKKLERIMEEL